MDAVKSKISLTVSITTYMHVRQRFDFRIKFGNLIFGRIISERIIV